MKKPQELNKAMRISIIEGIYAQIHSSLAAIGSNFITKAAVLLNATPMQFSLLAGVAQLSHFFQLYAVMHNKNVQSRKEHCIRFAFWGRFLSLFIGLSFAIVNPKLSFIFFLSLLFVSASLQTISSNMWVAWMTDLIPNRIRGRFFSRRMQIHLFCGIVIGYIFSFFTDLFEAEVGTWRYSLIERFQLFDVFKPDNLPIGLAIVFIIGSLFGMYGLRILGRQGERRIQITDYKSQITDTAAVTPIQKTDTVSTEYILSQQKSVVNLFEPLKNKDFRRLLHFGLWWMFAIGIGSQFWGPFMLQVLKMSLVEMQIYGMLQAIAMLLSFRFWGRFIDKYGNKKAMQICVAIGSINPLLWIFFSEASYSLIWLEGFSSGIMWSGANLVTFNFVLSIAPRGKEQHWSAVYSAFAGLMMLTTILLSGLLYPPTLTIGSFVLLPEQVLFVATGILRLTAEIPLSRINHK